MPDRLNIMTIAKMKYLIIGVLSESECETPQAELPRARSCSLQSVELPQVDLVDWLVIGLRKRWAWNRPLHLKNDYSGISESSACRLQAGCWSLFSFRWVRQLCGASRRSLLWLDRRFCEFQIDLRYWGAWWHWPSLARRYRVLHPASQSGAGSREAPAIAWT